MQTLRTLAILRPPSRSAASWLLHPEDCVQQVKPKAITPGRKRLQLVEIFLGRGLLPKLHGDAKGEGGGG